MGCESCNSSEKVTCCEGCDSCNDCNSCESCDSCNDCDSCEEKCQDKAQLISDINGSFSFSNSPFKAGDSLISASEWNSLISYIEKGYSLRGANAGLSKVNSRDIMSASIYNNALGKMESNSGYKTSNPVSKDTLVLARYFNDIEDYANEEFTTPAGSYCSGNCDDCDDCNNSCESNCDDCNDCDSCNDCNSECSDCVSSQREDCEEESSEE